LKQVTNILIHKRKKEEQVLSKKKTQKGKIGKTPLSLSLPLSSLALGDLDRQVADRLQDLVRPPLRARAKPLELPRLVSEALGDVELGLGRVVVVLGVGGRRDERREHGLRGAVGEELEDHQGLLVGAAADGVEDAAELFFELVVEGLERKEEVKRACEFFFSSFVVVSPAAAALKDFLLFDLSTPSRFLPPPRLLISSLQTHFVRRAAVVLGLGGSALVVDGSGRHDRRGR
jgi:hypothetical protein